MMENYLRLLNPKTTNFDAIGGGSHDAMTSQDVCVSLSYARLTPVQNHLIELCVLNRNSMEQIKASNQVIYEWFVRTQYVEMSQEHELSIFVALIELCKVPANYSPSERNRAVIAGVSRMQIQRKLGQKINYFKKQLQAEIEIASKKIKHQLNKST